MKGQKAILFATTALAAVGLIGVGFSAWVVTGGSSASTDKISVNVGGVIDYRLNLSDLTVTSGDLWFDADPDDNSGNIKFSSQEGGLDYNLSFVVTYTLSSYSSAYSVYDLIGTDGVTAYMTTSKGTAWEEKIIQLPLSTDSENPDSVFYFSGTDPITSANYNNPSPSSSYVAYTWSKGIRYSTTYTDPTKFKDNTTSGIINATELNMTTTFNFEWGSYFNYRNPSHEAWSSADSSSAITALNTLCTDYNSVSFVVYLEATVRNT